MTAAAYAKDLLSRILPAHIEAEEKIAEILSNVLDSTTKIEVGVATVSRHLSAKQDFEIMNWLTPIDYGPVHSDTLRRRQPGTGQWLLDSPEYQRWLIDERDTLFCPGIPGAGKTVLTSVVINDLNSRYSGDLAVGVCYIYCNFRRQHEQNIDDLYASLPKPLCGRSLSLPDKLKVLHDLHKTQKTRPSAIELKGIFQDTVSNFSRAFVVIDALDECRISDNSRSRFLAQLFELQHRHRIKIFATSRFIPAICEQFGESMQLEIRAHKEDILTYLKHNMAPGRAFLQKNQTLQEDIREAIANAAEGMFLLAQLHFESLMTKMTERDVRDALQKLPTGSNAYDRAYDDALVRIKDQGVDAENLAMQLFMWITFTYRPLSTKAVQNALSVQLSQSKYDQSSEPDTQDMLSVCAGLVTIDAKSDTVRLLHYTTQRYFERTQDRWFADAHARIATLCTTYLSFTDFDRELCRTYRDLNRLLTSYPLWDYAANYWGKHARDSSYLPEAVIMFLKDAAKVDSSVLAMIDFTQRSNRSFLSTRCLYTFSRMLRVGSAELDKQAFVSVCQVTGLHLAIYLGLQAAVTAILSHEYVLDACDSYGCTALHWAVHRGNEQGLKLLLDKGYDPLRTTKNGATPFSLAAVGGHVTMLEIIQTHCDVNVDLPHQGEFGEYAGRTPLSCAAEHGQDAVVAWLLFQPGVDPNHKGPDNNWKTQY